MKPRKVFFTNLFIELENGLNFMNIRERKIKIYKLNVVNDSWVRNIILLPFSCFSEFLCKLNRLKLFFSCSWGLLFKAKKIVVSLHNNEVSIVFLTLFIYYQQNWNKQGINQDIIKKTKKKSR